MRAAVIGPDEDDIEGVEARSSHHRLSRLLVDNKVGASEERRHDKDRRREIPYLWPAHACAKRQQPPASHVGWGWALRWGL